MRKKMVGMLLVMAVFIAIVGTVKFQQVQAAIAQAMSYRPPPESVTTIVAASEPWEETVSAIGTVAPVQGVTVSADLPGIVAEIGFDSGQSVKEGAVLVRLDTKQERAQLAAAEAELELAGLQLERVRGLRDKGVTSQAELDTADAAAKTAEARVGEIQASIERKTIRAPFSGVLGIRQVNLGQYLGGGDPVVSLQSMHPIHVDFSVPQQQVGRLRVGAEVRVHADGGIVPQRTGRIAAIDSIVDEATRNVRIRATLPNTDGALRPGMFVEAEVPLGAGSDVVVLPATSISYAPYGDSVFVVESMSGPEGAEYLGVRQQFVKLGASRGDQVSVMSGIQAGEEVVTSGVFKLRNGAAVQVDNEIQPPNDAAPTPEES